MLRCLSIGLGCDFSIPKPATATSPTDDVLRFPIWIGQRVSWGSTNQIDVKIIQRALNLFPANEGGPFPKLKVDGIYGPLTNAAIVKFQKRYLGFADGAVDPGKATINKINEMEPIWLTVPPELIDRIYQVTLPTVVSCVVAANSTVLAARNTILFGPQGPINPSANQAALVNKHFALDRNPAKEHDLNLITDVFRDMTRLLQMNRFGSSLNLQTFIAAPGRFTFTWAYTSRNVALSQSDGLHLTGQSHHATAEDGTPLSLPDDKILILYPYIRSTSDAEICTIIHEMAHFVGPPDGNADVIDDQPGGYGPPQRIAQLTPAQRARNAENYSNFAFEARFGREPFNTLI
jgi:hypothetical protein